MYALLKRVTGVWQIVDFYHTLDRAVDDAREMDEECKVVLMSVMYG